MVMDAWRANESAEPTRLPASRWSRPLSLFRPRTEVSMVDSLPSFGKAALSAREDRTCALVAVSAANHTRRVFADRALQSPPIPGPSGSVVRSQRLNGFAD